MVQNETDPVRLANTLGIARLLGVGKAAVSNWPNRHEDFPRPVRLPHVVGIPLYDLDEVLEWARRHGKIPTP